MYKLENIAMLPGGMYEADLHFGGVIKKGKTFFPSSWSHEKLFSKIKEACNNITEIKRKRDSVIEITGKLSDNFKIITRIDKRGNIKTIFPSIE